MLSLADLARRVGKLTIDNSPTILTSIGVVGAVATAYLAGKASFQASDIIRLKEAQDEERGEEYLEDPREVMKKRVELVWRLYIPAATTGVATVACIIGANRVGARRAAGLAAAYSIVEKSFEDYKEKVIEKIGSRKEEQVRDEIMQDRVDRSYSPSTEIYGAEIGELCYDKFSDRYFRSTKEGIHAAENRLNYTLLHDRYASLSEFYQILGIPCPPFSEQVGWNSDHLLEVKVSTTLAEGDKPCLSMEFKNEPLPNYGRFH